MFSSYVAHFDSFVCFVLAMILLFKMAPKSYLEKKKKTNLRSCPVSYGEKMFQVLPAARASAPLLFGTRRPEKAFQ